MVKSLINNAKKENIILEVKGLKKYFPLEKKPPSNKVFIACVAEMLEEKQSPDL